MSVSRPLWLRHLKVSFSFNNIVFINVSFGAKGIKIFTLCSTGKLEDSVTRIRTHKKLLEGSRLKASRLTPVLAILATNIRNDMCKEVKLKVYFKNKKKSGGGKVQDVKIIAKGQAIVTFQDVEGDFVCKRVSN